MVMVFKNMLQYVLELILLRLGVLGDECLELVQVPLARVLLHLLAVAVQVQCGEAIHL